MLFNSSYDDAERLLILCALVGMLISAENTGLTGLCINFVNVGVSYVPELLLPHSMR